MLLRCALFTHFNWWIHVMMERNGKFLHSGAMKRSRKAWNLRFNYIFITFFFSDGALKYRNGTSQYHPGNGYTNPCLHTSVDQISTISRPRSSTDALNPSGGSPMHGNGRQLNGLLSRGANGLHEDLDFPPTPRTLTRKKNVVWMRPHVSYSKI